MAIPEDFHRESLYAPEQWYVHDVSVIDREAGRVVGVLDTTRIGALVDAQRPWPGHHKHLPGAVAIQITGTLAQIHGIYVLDLRATEGWVGYGTHIKQARFPKMGRIGPPVFAELVCKRVRNVRGTTFCDYAYRYEQEGEAVYESEQIAAWMRTEHRGPL